MKILISASVAALLVSTSAFANYPCSGMKGGVSHCEGRFFICNDGSASASKRNCSAEGQYGNAPPEKSPSENDLKKRSKKKSENN